MPRAPNYKAVTLSEGLSPHRREGTTNSKGTKLSWSLYLIINKLYEF